VLAFGSLAAAGLPLLLALSAVGGALGLVGMTSHALPVDESISSLVLLIGLAVGVDYSLFYIRRAREERAAGSDAAGAVQAASATSGRAILISGITVMVAMAGMYLTGNQVFTGFANGMVIVVAVAMLGSVTALPATLAWLGDRVERGHVPLLGGRWREAIEARAWSAVLDVVLRRPLLSALVAVALLVALCVPALGLHTVQAGTQGLPRSIPIMRTYDRIQTAFPGGPLPAQVVVEAADVRAPGVAGAIRALRRRAVATGLMQEPIEVDVNRGGTVARVAIPLAGSGTDARSVRALRALRAEVIPATLGRVEGVRFGVSGMTAWSTDFNDLLRSRAPWVFVFVLGLAFLLLLVTFRSIVIPIKAIVLNLLSVGAAYGVLVLVFQDGYGESLLGFRSIGGIVAWLPLFLFVILFGLSMDYHVFILSRIREAFDRGMSTDRAVAFGIKSTASVVTSAAFVMVAVFAIFATLSTIDMKQIGVGLAVAILIDATLVRAVLLPASMKLLGDWNWYLPRALRWLPRITHEPAAS